MANPAFADKQFFTDPGNIVGSNSGEVELFGMFPESLQQAVADGISGRFVAEDHALVIIFPGHTANSLYKHPIPPVAIRQ